ncbi:MAG TPA: branched-chain amino acid ABC transporter substrate-binding protein [Candidatus Angelobacter sp.]|jgi:branched-chain amino acid transport system substrate-binding protein|nr:branched-chain amino acid ABC transporter substrate-binding protein [Candidatus Angelobacter sp.]
MQRTHMRLVPILGAVSLAVLAGCGTSNNTTGPSSGGGGGLSNCSGSVTVASDLPVSGSDASDGKPTQNGAQLAVTQATNNKLLGGCTIKFVAKDDASVALGKHDPQQGAQNITELAGDSSVLGVVGPFNSNVALSELPIANKANLVMISPSNTNPGLTIVGSNPDIPTASLKPTGNTTYFRVCTTDIGQGKADAQEAAQTLGTKKAYVFDDQETYGKGLADQFSKFFMADGGTIAKRTSLPGDTKDFSTQLTDAKNLGVDVIFFGGTSSNGGGIIKKQMAAAGLTSVKYVGGDGIVDQEFFTEAGTAADGAYGSVAAPDPTKLSTAAQFVTDYTAAFGAAPGAYSANAYDAMNILLQAVKKAITDNGGTLPSTGSAFRESVRKDVLATSWDGAIGHTTFDANGDTSNVLLTIFLAQGGKWTYSATVKTSA